MNSRPAKDDIARCGVGTYEADQRLTFGLQVAIAAVLLVPVVGLLVVEKPIGESIKIHLVLTKLCFAELPMPDPVFADQAGARMARSLPGAAGGRYID